MEDQILRFITALRAGGVRISLAESADAFKAVEHMGIKDRNAFRLSLFSTLVKDQSSIPIFDELFPLFFGNMGPPPMMNLAGDLTPEEARMLAEALRLMSEHLREILERLMQGEPLSQEELERLARFTGLHHAGDMRYQDWMARRMQKALDFPEVREALRELMELLARMGMDKGTLEHIRQLIQANMQGMEEQMRQYAGQRIAENMSTPRPQDGPDRLLNQPFNALSRNDLQRLRQEVRRLAAALRTRVALRQKRAKSGQLDAKATIRANLKHGNVPILIKYRDRSLKPKLVVICDISTSVRPMSELMLSLLYALQDQISKTHAFAFIDHLEYISPEFTRFEATEAVARVLERMPSGYYNTDLGSSLEDFIAGYLDTVDPRTTFIMVGDGRNNYNDPRLDLFQMLARRSHRAIWFNPEAPMLWGTGDSDMLEYSPYCHHIFQVSNLKELAMAVDQLLTW